MPWPLSMKVKTSSTAVEARRPSVTGATAFMVKANDFEERAQLRIQRMHPRVLTISLGLGG